MSLMNKKKTNCNMNLEFKKTSILNVFLCIMFFSIVACGQDSKAITKELLKEKKKQLSKEELEMLKKYSNGIDTLSVKESKNFLTDYIDYFLKKKENIKNRSLEIRDISKEEELHNVKKLDTALISKAIRQLKTDVVFKQTFENDTTLVDFSVKGKGAYRKSHVNEKYTVKKIYYRGGGVEEKNEEFPYLSMAFNGKAQYIDSVKVEADLTYTNKYNVQTLKAKEKLIEKGGLTLLELQHNYAYFKLENPETLFLMEAYNKRGISLGRDEKWRGFVKGNEATVYDDKIALLKQAKANFKKVKTDKEASLVLENLNIDLILEIRAHKYFQYTFQGNIDNIKVYTDGEKENKKFLFTAVNETPVCPAYIMEKNNKTHFINTDGELLFKTKKTGLEFVNFFYLEDEDDNYYYLDINKKKLTPLKLEDAFPLTDTLLEVSKGELSAILNEKNENVSGYVYNKIKLESKEYNPDNIILVGERKKIGEGENEVIINEKGKEVHSSFKAIGSFYNGFASAANKEKKEGIINSKGEVVVSLVYDRIRNLNDGDLFMIKKNNLLGIINNRGEIILPIAYSKIDFFSKHRGLTAVENKKRHRGYINHRGELVIPVNHYNYGFGTFQSGCKIIKTIDNEYALISAEGEYSISYTKEKITKEEENKIIYYKVGSKKYNTLGQIIKD